MVDMSHECQNTAESPQSWEILLIVVNSIVTK
jgi:hypothetical protein